MDDASKEVVDYWYGGPIYEDDEDGTAKPLFDAEILVQQSSFGRLPDKRLKSYGKCAGLEGCALNMLDKPTDEDDDETGFERYGLLDPAVRAALLELEEEPDQDIE